jgi:sterol desaturase/sphingolipid hydroxylase (fatty acid hydroxylase superfamily)
MRVLATLFLEPVKALLVAALVFIPFERLAHARASQRVFRTGWATDALTGLLNGILLFAALLIVFARIDSFAAASWPALRRAAAAQPLWRQALLSILIGDLGLYFVHRLSHAVPWLWRFHVVHHSAEEMDWLIGFRFHPIDLFLVRVGMLAAPVALNVTPAAMAVMVAVFTWNSWLVHANVRVRYGPLKWLLVSPEFHHWHHSRSRDAHDRNYASVIACWDVVFGTVHLPRGHEPAGYGVGEPVPASWIARFFYPFRWTRTDGVRRRGAKAHPLTAP